MKWSCTDFSFSTCTRKHEVLFFLQLHTKHHHTDAFPDIIDFLLKEAPATLQSKCYNPDHHSFPEEVRRTEIGHLFEHIFLTFLCEEELLAGAQKATHRATTEWNWRKHPRGSFTITLHTPTTKPILEKAAVRSSEVLRRLYSTTSPKAQQLTLSSQMGQEPQLFAYQP